nr:MAG TPA: hypothetical protein [Caudoviricetes sp.]
MRFILFKSHNTKFKLIDLQQLTIKTHDKSFYFDVRIFHIFFLSVHFDSDRLILYIVLQNPILLVVINNNLILSKQIDHIPKPLRVSFLLIGGILEIGNTSRIQELFLIKRKIFFHRKENRPFKMSFCQQLDPFLFKLCDIICHLDKFGLIKNKASYLVGKVFQLEHFQIFVYR